MGDWKGSGCYWVRLGKDSFRPYPAFGARDLPKPPGVKGYVTYRIQMAQAVLYAKRDGKSSEYNCLPSATNQHTASQMSFVLRIIPGWQFVVRDTEVSFLLLNLCTIKPFKADVNVINRLFEH